MANRGFHYGRDADATEVAMAAVRAMPLSASPVQAALIAGLAERVEVDPEVDGRAVSVREGGTFTAIAAAFVTLGWGDGASFSDEVALEVTGRVVGGVATVDGYVARLEPFA